MVNIDECFPYALYACLNLYGIMLNLDDMLCLLRDEMSCNDDYYMWNASLVGIYGMPRKVGL